jgi:hypothetical protein
LVLSRLVESIRGFWSELEFRIAQDAVITADRRAILSVLRNLIQNAVLHGEATTVEFSAKALGNGRVRICVQDNGTGVKGDVKDLGRQMRLAGKPGAERAMSEEGNGIGLYLSQRLLRKMKGHISFEKPMRGFLAIIELPGEVL